MALLGSFIDSRTNALLATTATTTFAHGLPAAPDFVLVQAISTAATNGVGGFDANSDATNVTVRNNAAANSSTFRVISVVAHSMIR